MTKLVNNKNILRCELCRKKYEHWVPMAKALLALLGRSKPQGDNDLKPYDAKEH